MAAEAVVSAVVAASACRSFPAADLLICLAKEEGSIWSLSLASLLLIPYSWIPYLALSLAGLYFLTYRTSFAMLVGIFIVGLGILNEGLLKNVIKQPRPEGTCACGFGMPSGHAAITTGLLVWLTLELLLNNWSPPFIARWNTRGKLLLLGILVLLLLPTSYSRVRFRYHTWEQVAVGSMVGGVYAIVFYCLLAFFIGHHLDALVKWKLISWLGVKNIYPRRPSSGLLIPIYSTSAPAAVSTPPIPQRPPPEFYFLGTKVI